MPVYELMRKDQRVTVLAVNKTGGIEKCDYKNINQENTRHFHKNPKNIKKSKKLTS